MARTVFEQAQRQHRGVDLGRVGARPRGLRFWPDPVTVARTMHRSVLRKHIIGARHPERRGGRVGRKE